MTDSPLVSILTPCYNTGKYIHRLLDSILQQDYPRIEMILIDDGSIDDTSDIIKSYFSKFNDRGYEIRYHYQLNQGQSVAINNGLRFIKGEYLVWPDSDDWYNLPDSISRLVRELQNSEDDVAMVRGRQLYISDIDFSVTGTSGSNYNHDDSRIFYDCLFGENGFWLASGGYMLKTNILHNLLPDGIYSEKNAGQNWQILLPILYSYRCKTIMDPINCVLQRSDSHSRGQYSSYTQKLERLNSYERTILGTLQRIDAMDSSERKVLSTEIKHKYLKERLFLACSNNHYNDALRYWNSLKQSNASFTLRDKIRFIYVALHLRKPLAWLKRKL